MNQSNVIIVPGSFAGTLGTDRSTIWIDPFALAAGRFVELTLPDAGTVGADGPLPGYYHLLELGLSAAGFGVVYFAYDWRQDADTIAPQLAAMIERTPYPVYLVAHSLGADVARRAIQLLSGRMGQAHVIAKVGGMALLGPANRGTLAGAIGLAAATKLLPGFDLMPSPPSYVQPVLRTFPSLYQVLPWDSADLASLDDPDHDVRNPGFWRGLVDADTLLKYLPIGGPAWASTIDTTFFGSRISIILGDARYTAGGVWFRGDRLEIDESCDVPGDGFVPRACSYLDRHSPAYIASGVGHLQLPMSDAVICGVIDLFRGRYPTTLGRYA